MADRTIDSLPPLSALLTDQIEIQRANNGPWGKTTLQEIVDLVPAASVAWGQITGTLANQTDLQNALDAKTDNTAFNSHTGNASIHFTEGSIDHTAIQNVGSNTHAQIDSHIASSTIHFTVGSIDHSAIQNVGSNTHAQIDTHIANSDIHFSDAPADSQQYARINNGWQVVAGGGGGEANDGANLGAGEGIFAQKVGIELQFKSLVAGSNVSFDSDANTVTINSTATGTGGSEIWRFSTTTSPVPSSGQIRYNSATPAAVTEIYVSANAKNGNDLSSLIARLDEGSSIYVQDAGTSANYIAGVLNTDVIDNGTWLQLNITVENSGGTVPGNNQDTILRGEQAAGAQELTDLSDVTISAPSVGEVLRYNGSVFTNETLVVGDVSGLQAALDAKADLAGDTFTGPMLFADGSVTNPSIAFGSETNTGLYRVSPGVVGLTVGGVLLVTFSAANGIRSADDVQGFQTLP